ncbi:hypothetical protein VFPPC_14433 [Pochonia chlamydosporia 170]|uniref:Uncharacterized protein n=1 Tax=Pochonia chlamydosporia 170 TaxID=1380566 RepID=A0A179FNF3_METCM|nr:hypothetical protein VFPPC_14433 [Pochonia chlamydosporia 170]OAQ67104.1 hypothetical protein VFPPC_14433 [Pochonia chlamydosporia 170]
MPTIVRPRPEKVGLNTDKAVHSSAALLKQTSTAWTVDKAQVTDYGVQTNKRIGPENRAVLRTSFSYLDETPRSIVPYGNGFVDGIIRAFQQDLHLVLRPDDVWLAILTQFSFYVNGASDELRDKFVDHDGKKTICVDVTPQKFEDVDIGKLSVQFTQAMKKQVKDGDEFVDWLLPKFSTTTETDEAVAAIMLMSTMKSYFEYLMLCGCGFPSVTLQGSRDDWVDIRNRIPRFADYGTDAKEWSVYLEKILDKMILSFDEPESRDVRDFWMNVRHAAGHDGSMDMRTMSGWITAFCFWTQEGKRNRGYEDEVLYARGESGVDRRRLVLDGVRFPVMHWKAVTRGVAEVGVTVVDLRGERMETTVVAGSVGVEGVGGGDGGGDVVGDRVGGGAIGVVRPVSGWWMLLDRIEKL